jgi:uncharacterized protein (TIGR02266 family)
VDDSALIRELGSLFLSRAGRVATAGSGEEALCAARRRRPDLVFTSLRLPGMDGVALCRALHGEPTLADVPVVVLCAGGRAVDRERALRSGAWDVLPKPIERGALLDCAQRLLHASGPLGLPRVPVETRVRLRAGRGVWEGVARNVSRGGLFVTSERLAEPRSELEVEIELPELARRLDATVQVIWVRPGEAGVEPGMGLRFLGLDGQSVLALTHYVEERIPTLAPPRLELVR